jgi:hypothetical protein
MTSTIKRNIKRVDSFEPMNKIIKETDENVEVFDITKIKKEKVDPTYEIVSNSQRKKANISKSAAATVSSDVAPLSKSKISSSNVAPVKAPLSSVVAPVSKSKFVSGDVAPVTSTVSGVVAPMSKSNFVSGDVAPVTSTVSSVVAPVTTHVAPMSSKLASSDVAPVSSIVASVSSEVARVKAPVSSVVTPEPNSIAPVSSVVAAVSSIVESVSVVAALDVITNAPDVSDDEVDHISSQFSIINTQSSSDSAENDGEDTEGLFEGNRIVPFIEIENIDIRTKYAISIKGRCILKSNQRKFERGGKKGTAFHMDFIDINGHLMRVVGWTKNVLIHDIIEVNSIYNVSNLEIVEPNEKFNFLNNRVELHLCHNSTVIKINDMDMPPIPLNIKLLDDLGDQGDHPMVDVLVKVKEIGIETDKYLRNQQKTLRVKSIIVYDKAKKLTTLNCWDSQIDQYNFKVGNVVLLKNAGMGHYNQTTLSLNANTTVIINPDETEYPNLVRFLRWFTKNPSLNFSKRN